MSLRSAVSLVIAPLFLLAGTSCLAAETSSDLGREVEAYLATESGPDWHGVVALYVWIPSLQTTFSFDDGGGGEPPEADVDEGLQFEWGITGHVEVGTGRWSFFADALYVEYGAGAQVLRQDAQVDLDALLVEIGAAWGVLPADAGGRWGIEALGGARFADLTLRTVVTGTDVSNSRSADWVEPFVGFRVRYALDEEHAWQLLLRADVGGFGLGSELTWNVILGASWDFAERWTLLVGYRWLDIDYEDSGPSGTLPLHIRIEGPWLAIAFSF